tara:strand:- start:20 stop:217 length:198 start_codon:yes stop_codon:yes gene_type:complete
MKIEKVKISYLIDHLILEEEIKYYTNEILRTGWCLYNIEDYQERMYNMGRKKIKELELNNKQVNN